MRQAIHTQDAPQAIGPYSQAIRTGELLFVSGQIPLDPSTGEMVKGDIKAQTEQVMKNIASILAAANVSFDHVVRTTIFLADLSDFAVVNEIYGNYFETPEPVRAAFQVARLPKDARVEIDAIALL